MGQRASSGLVMLSIESSSTGVAPIEKIKEDTKMSASTKTHLLTVLATSLD